MLCNSLLSRAGEVGSVVTAGYIQSPPEESNTITASVPALPITVRCAVVCAPEMFPFFGITLRVVTEAIAGLIFMLIAFLQCAL